MDIRPILSTLMRHKTAASLIVIEIALTCAIICNALFMISDRIREVREVSGLVEDELVRVQILSIGSDADQSARTRTDLANLRAIPGVKDATVLNQVPFVNSSWNSGVRLSKDQHQSTMVATSYMADEHFLGTFGLKLVAGRNFEPGEYIEYEDFDKPGADVAIPGAIITEKVYVWHGMGDFLNQALPDQDINKVVGWVMVSAIFVALFNLVADLLYAVLDPRIRLS